MFVYRALLALSVEDKYELGNQVEKKLQNAQQVYYFQCKTSRRTYKRTRCSWQADAACLAQPKRHPFNLKIEILLWRPGILPE